MTTDPGLSLTPDSLLRELAQPTAMQIAPVTGGADTQIWRVALPDGDFALRLLRPDQRFAAARERAAMEAARAAGIPAPGVRAAGEVAGRPVLLLDWLPGSTLLKALAQMPHSAAALGDAFGVMQARMHQISAPPAVMRADRSWIDWADPGPALRERLTVAADGPARLLHFDYHPLNVLTEGGAITGVLDWTNATGGDPRADVARTYTILHFSLPALPGASGTMAIAIAEFTRQWWNGYVRTAGNGSNSANCAKNANSGSMATVANMELFLAWAGLVMLRDLSPRLGRDDLPWLTMEYLDRVHRWTREMQKRSGTSA